MWLYQNVDEEEMVCYKPVEKQFRKTHTPNEIDILYVF